MRHHLLRECEKYLDCHESTPSAHYMVWSIVNGDSDEKLDYFYNSSEGWNDSHRDEILKNMTDEQLFQLAALALEITMEKLAVHEE